MTDAGEDVSVKVADCGLVQVSQTVSSWLLILTQQRFYLLDSAAVDAVAFALVGSLILEQKLPGSEIGYRPFDNPGARFNHVGHQPPFNDSFQRVLRVRMFEQVRQDGPRDLFLFYPAHRAPFLQHCLLKYLWQESYRLSYRLFQ